LNYKIEGLGKDRLREVSQVFLDEHSSKERVPEILEGDDIT
jgi:hypothetical protein